MWYFLFFALNVNNFGYSTSSLNLCFEHDNEKSHVYRCKLQFYNIKLPRFEGSTLHVCDSRVMFIIMCDFYILILDFRGELDRKNIFLSASRSQFVLTRPAKILEIGQQIKFLWLKWILNKDFSLVKNMEGRFHSRKILKLISYSIITWNHHKMSQNTYMRSNHRVQVKNVA